MSTFLRYLKYLPLLLPVIEAAVDTVQQIKRQAEQEEPKAAR